MLLRMQLLLTLSEWKLIRQIQVGLNKLAAYVWLVPKVGLQLPETAVLGSDNHCFVLYSTKLCISLGNMRKAAGCILSPFHEHCFCAADADCNQLVLRKKNLSCLTHGNIQVFFKSHSKNLNQKISFIYHEDYTVEYKSGGVEFTIIPNM